MTTSVSLPLIYSNKTEDHETLQKFFALYKKYHSELVDLSLSLHKKFYPMQSAGYLTTFGDVEGEVMYMLAREEQPEVVFEISPNAGWSSNYILAALTKNNKGILHSFDILTHMFGRPMEEVVRNNQCKLCDQSRFQLHIGDARETTKKIAGEIQFLLIDSDHTDRFAQWYVKEIFPRVRGAILIQDIAHWDRRESSSEATYILDWIKRENIDVTPIGEIERAIRVTDIRDGIVERRGLRSNSLMLSSPFVSSSKTFQLAQGPDDFLKQTATFIVAGEKRKALMLLSRIMNILVTDPTRVNRHRLFMKMCELYQTMGETNEARRCAQRAYGIVMGSDLQQRRKLMPELLILFLRKRQWQLFLQMKLMIFLSPSSWGLMLKATMKFFLDILHRR